MTTSTDAARPDDFEVRLDAKALKSASIQGSLLIGSAQIFKLLLQIGSQVVLARLLFPGDFGLVAMVYPIISFAQIFADIGFGEAVIQRERLDQARVSALFWVSLALSCGLMVLVMALSPIAAWTYREPRVTLLMMVVALGMPIAALGGVQGALLTRQMQFRTIVKIEMMGALITTGATVAGALAGWSYWSLAAGTLIGQGASAAMNWIASGWRPSRPARSSELVEDLKFGGNVTGFNLATFLTQSGDNVIIGLVNGQYALGLYDRSYRLVVQPIGQVLAPIGRVGIPLLSRLNGDPAEYRRVALVILRTVLMLTAPGMLVCVFFSGEIVHILLGPRWAKAAPILGWLAVGGVTGPVQAVALWLFISQGRMRGLRAFTLATSLLSVGSYLIGSFWGAKGVAVSVSLIYTFITTPLIIYGATRNGPIGLAILLRSCAPFVIAVALTAGAFLALRSLGIPGEILRLICATATGYAIFALVGLGPPDERRKVVAMLRMVRGSR